VGPLPRRWTREEFYRLGELGFFRGQRVELIEGDLMILSPQNWLHASTVDKVYDRLRGLLAPGFWVRMQLPLHIRGASDPEPDVSVVLGRREDYTDHPTSAALIVEVSDTSLLYDRGTKASLYAAAGITDYWIVNLIDRQLEIRRSPRPDPAMPFGAGYAILTVHPPADVASPLAAPQSQVPVADLLP
jgi:Uma2 family endonuclease